MLGWIGKLDGLEERAAAPHSRGLGRTETVPAPGHKQGKGLRVLGTNVLVGTVIQTYSKQPVYTVLAAGPQDMF